MDSAEVKDIINKWKNYEKKFIDYKSFFDSSAFVNQLWLGVGELAFSQQDVLDAVGQLSADSLFSFHLLSPSSVAVYPP
jgi:hypothetical protein